MTQTLPDTDKAIYSVLGNSSDVSTWVGTDSDGLKKIYNTIAPQGATLPLIVFQKISNVPAVTTRQAFDTQYQIVVEASSNSAAHTGAGYVFAALHRAALSLSGWGAYGAFCVNEFKDFEFVNGVEYHRRILEFNVSFVSA